MSKDLFLTLREKSLEQEKTAEKVQAAKILMYLKNFNLNKNEK